MDDAPPAQGSFAPLAGAGVGVVLSFAARALHRIAQHYNTWRRLDSLPQWHSQKAQAIQTVITAAAGIHLT